MAWQIKRRRLRIWAALLVVGIAAGAGGYIALDRMAQARAEEAIAQMRQRLPEGTRLAYSSLDASVISQSATLNAAVLRRGEQQLRAAKVTIGGVTETDGGNLRAGRIDADNVTARHPNGLRLAAARVELRDVLMSPTGDALRSLGRARVSTLSLTKGDAELRATDLGLRGATPRRLGRFSAGIIEMRGLAADTADREVFRNVTLQGLKLSPIPPPDRWTALDPGEVAGIAADLSYDALRMGKAELHRAGKRRLLVRGLESSQTREGDRRIWQTGVDHFAAHASRTGPTMARLVDDSGMLRGRFSGRQVYDVAAGTLTLKDMALEITDAGRLSGTMQFAGLPTGAQGFMPGRTSLAQAKLAALDVTFADKGVLKPALDALAAQQGVSREELIDRRLGAIDRKARDASEPVQASVHALRRFLNEGGTLHVTMDPEREVAMSKAMMAFVFQPVRTAEAMNLRIARK